MEREAVIRSIETIDDFYSVDGDKNSHLLLNKIPSAVMPIIPLPSCGSDSVRFA